MKIALEKWIDAPLEAISDIFTRADRRYLSDGLPLPYTTEHARRWLENTVLPKDGSLGLYRLIRVDGAYAGQISIERGQDVFACDAELGYILLDEYKGCGVMSTAVHAACCEAFATLDILRISAKVFSSNIASQRVLEKNGFLLEGRIKNAVCKDGRILDLLCYGKQRQS